MEILLLHGDQLTRKILNVLNELAPTKGLTLSAAKRIIDNNIKCNSFTYVLYVNGEPIAIATLVILEKMIHDGSYVALIEDVAVLRKYQKRGYGKAIVEHCIAKAKHNLCYKAILVCRKELEPFYESIGFKHSGECMRINLK